MQFNKVEICGINTNDLKVLKESEKIELLRKAHSGDKQGPCTATKPESYS